MKRKLLNALIFAGALAVIICAVKIYGEYAERAENTKLMEGLSEELFGKKAHNNLSPFEGADLESLERFGFNAEEDIRAFLAGLCALANKNPDMKGFISSADGSLGYPVMQSDIRERDFYLSHDFNGKSSSYGSIYMDSACRPSAGEKSYIIYGHNMKDGSMFGSLDEISLFGAAGRNASLKASEEADSIYKEKNSDNENLICLWLKEDSGAFVPSVYELTAKLTLSPEEFKREEFLGILKLETKEALEELNDFIKSDNRRVNGKESFGEKTENKNKSPAAELSENDDIIVLVTCEYSQENGRLFLIGKKLKNK